MPSAARFRRSLAGEPLQFDSLAKADEFLEHIMSVMRERAGCREWYIDPEETRGVLTSFTLEPRSVEVTTRLEAHVVGGRLAFAISLAGSRASVERDEQKWLDAIAEAKTRLGRPHPSWKWQAVIGLTPGGMGSTVRLRERTLVGSTILKPWEAGYLEHVPIRENGRTVERWWWPIHLSGTSLGLTEPEGLIAARRLSHEICCLIAVAWNVGFDLARAPQGADTVFELPEPPRPPAFRVDVDLPSWMTTALQLVQTDREVGIAVGAFHEGIRLHEEHPSFAMVAFSACIEGLARRIKGAPERSRARVRYALSKVLPQKELQSLDYLYGRRSTTAHEGRTFGSEAWFGRSLGGLSIFRATDPHSRVRFEYTDVRRAREAARLVLAAVFDGRIMLI